jgi:hypothetical protein
MQCNPAMTTRETYVRGMKWHGMAWHGMAWHASTTQRAIRKASAV